MTPSTLLRTGATLLAATTVLATAAAGPLERERWKTRPLVVFAASADDPLLAGLQADLKKPDTRAAFAEREMVVYAVVGDQAKRDGQPLPAGEAAALRQALGGRPGEAVLVGKDGGVKLRQSERVDLATIFTTIDGMPMRRR